MRRTRRAGTVGHLDLALTIHEVLDEPTDNHGEPKLGYQIVKAIIASMRDALQRGEDVYINGFGRLRIVTRTPKRTGNNFITPTDRSPVPLTHSPRKYIVFTPSIQLQAMLNATENGGTPNFKEARAAATWTDTDDNQ